MKGWRRFLARGVLPLAVWLLVWQGAVWYLQAVRGIRSDLILPAPLTVARTLAELAGTAEFWHTTFLTLLRIFGGLLWGVLAAVVIWSVLSAAAYLGLGFTSRAW